jgi:GxxExxY protein
MINELLHREITERVIGVFYDVHWELGFGFLESVYKNAMCYALEEAGLRLDREVPIDVVFRGRRVGRFRADIIVESRVLIELKASERIEPKWEAQVINYLRSTNLEVALLLHFGHRAGFKRRVVTASRKRSAPRR